MYRRRRRKKPKSGIHGRPPFPCTVDGRESEPAVQGSLRRAKLRRALDRRLRFPRKITEKRYRGLWDIGSQSCPTAQRFVSDPPAVPRFVGTARRNFSSRCAIKTVSRPAGSLKFNLRGRRYAVPANGCLVTLMRWPNLQRIQFGKSVQTVNPATVASPEILPISPRRCVFSLDKSLSWMSFA